MVVGEMEEVERDETMGRRLVQCSQRTALHSTQHAACTAHSMHYSTARHSTAEPPIYLIIGEVKVEHGELRRGHGVDRMLHEGDGVEVAGKVHHETFGCGGEAAHQC